MIKIFSLEIENFRGIKAVRLELKGKSLVIGGPNGSGKSGIVDAIEFALTGDISRLHGEGTARLNLRNHGPHVDTRGDATSSRVKLVVERTDTHRQITVERSMSKPGSVKLTPDDANSRQLIASLSRHAELVLTRREILKYVLSEPGKRAQDVKALLRLDRLDDIRSRLRATKTQVTRQEGANEARAAEAKADLRAAVGGTGGKEDVIRAVNERRKLLGLPEISDLQAETKVSEGMLAVRAAGGGGAVHKVVALRDVRALDELLATSRSSIEAAGARLVQGLNLLAAKPEILEAVEHRDFLRAGLARIAADACPFCDHAWDVEKLRAHVQAKLAKAREGEEVQRLVIGAMETLVNNSQGFARLLSRAAEYARAVGAASEEAALAAAAARLSEVRYEDRIRELVAGRARFANFDSFFPTNTDALAALRARLEGIPDTQQVAEAEQFLYLVDERLRMYREAKRAQTRSARARKEIEATIFAFDVAADRALESLYAAIQEDLARYYREINADDEAAFTARLEPGPGKLDLSVDFYGRGMFPPAAYHSEGHQDALGLCVYLALMRHVHGAGFPLAVLDDVLISIDTAHRRDVARLLKTEFPNTQFIITTHDQVWFRYLRGAGVVPSGHAIQFTRWTVEVGPIVERSAEPWVAIDDRLSRNDIQGAAHALRYYLEWTAGDLCDEFRAPVAYRADGAHDLGDLLPTVVAVIRKYLRMAKVAAESWGQVERAAEISAREDRVQKSFAETNMEQWAINKAVHHNPWANFAADEFLVVVMAFRGLLDGLRCVSCQVFFRVDSTIDPKVLTCPCGTTSYTLEKKSKSSHAGAG